MIKDENGNYAWESQQFVIWWDNIRVYEGKMNILLSGIKLVETRLSSENKSSEVEYEEDEC